jgi:holo-ACP synthase/triphosphoribosyl-dephospho-CoA synthase
MIKELNKNKAEYREVSLEEVLRAREETAALQADLISRYRLPLISFTMNIAGEVKRNSLTDFAFDSGLAEVIGSFGKPVAHREARSPAGSRIIFVYDIDPELLKRGCIGIEENHPAGRLFDLDVIAEDGKKISGKDVGAPFKRDARKCIVCGGPVYICSRARAHGLDEVKEVTTSILKNFAAEEVGKMAARALVEEAELTPKPGLVDRNNSGAHDDMDLDLMVKSALNLEGYFRSVAACGLKEETADHPLHLKELGLEAERNMYELTGGVNTHKGAVFAMGLGSYAVSRRLVTGCEIFREIGEMAGKLSLISDENPIFAIKDQIKTGGNTERGNESVRSHGEIVRKRYGRGSALEDAKAGFPAAREALTYMTENPNDMLGAFIYTMTKCEDTNLLYRGGPQALNFAVKTAKDILSLPGEDREKACIKADELFIGKNLSPGGSADMFALARMIFNIDSRYNL